MYKHVIVLSENMKKKINDINSKINTVVIPNGVSINKTMKKDDTNNRKKYSHLLNPYVNVKYYLIKDSLSFLKLTHSSILINCTSNKYMLFD